jgi:hypothetical protein
MSRESMPLKQKSGISHSSIKYRTEIYILYQFYICKANLGMGKSPSPIYETSELTLLVLRALQLAAQLLAQLPALQLLAAQQELHALLVLALHE